MWQVMGQGFALGGGLIVAIGAQNAFVLSQGIRRNHHWSVAALCSLCDFIMIAVGVAGAGALVAAHPVWAKAAAWGGAAFLAWYGAKALASARRGGQLRACRGEAMGLGRTLAMTLAVTVLNPHAYLDTVVLLGAVSGQFPADQRPFFGLGASLASLLWFFGLSLGGRALAPWFARPVAWRILDGLVCLTMWSLAASLVWSA